MTGIGPGRGSRVLQAHVHRAERVSEGFVRMTVRGLSADDFVAQGFDQWMRLFVCRRGQTALHLPEGPSAGWYSRWLGMPESIRPLCRNYTVREARRVPEADRGSTGPRAGDVEIDIDFVVHGPTQGAATEDTAASWAASARPGMPVGLLDQGLIFNPRIARGHVVVVADESGVPAAEGIVRSLPPGTRAEAILDIAHGDDARELLAAADLRSRWSLHSPGGAPSRDTLAVLESLALGEETHVYVAGEAAYIAAVRDALARIVPALTEPDPGKPFTGSGPTLRTCAYWRGPSAERRSAR